MKYAVTEAWVGAVLDERAHGLEAPRGYGQMERYAVRMEAVWIVSVRVGGTH